MGGPQWSGMGTRSRAGFAFGVSVSGGASHVHGALLASLAFCRHETAEELFNTQFQLSFADNKQVRVSASRPTRLFHPFLVHGGMEL